MTFFLITFDEFFIGKIDFADNDGSDAIFLFCLQFQNWKVIRSEAELSLTTVFI